MEILGRFKPNKFGAPTLCQPSARLRLGLAGEFQDEGGAVAGAVAVSGQRAAQLFGGQGAVVQAETVALALLAGGETVLEDTGEIFRRDADAVVADGELEGLVWGRLETEDHPFVGTALVVEGVFGVADEIDENLKDLVFVYRDRGHLGELADDFDLVALQGAGIEAQGVFDQLGEGECFDEAANGRVALLHRDNLFDVFDIGRKRLEFVQHFLLFAGQVFGQVAQVGGQLFAFRVLGQKGGKIGGMGVEEGDGPGKIGELGTADFVEQERAGDIDAVEDVADVVQDAGGDVSHAGLAGDIEQPAVQLLQLGLRIFAVGDVLENAHRTDGPAGFIEVLHRGIGKPARPAVAGHDPHVAAPGAEFAGLDTAGGLGFVQTGGLAAHDGFLDDTGPNLAADLARGVAGQLLDVLADEYIGVGPVIIHVRDGPGAADGSAIEFLGAAEQPGGLDAIEGAAAVIGQRLQDVPGLRGCRRRAGSFES